ncbi:tRNA-dihydrouridine synthase family protein [Helicobacter aurati]|uniref:tRNA-dihydrouridine synthase n=1 Tax=Helicobacter aurati TaxID=137778 RepID=A0A3D8J375_9HELI|nr:tRNA-dihydrouridine synthase family protein [Helicobacter aurati]
MPLLILAPLAGYSDVPFRKIVKDIGVDITVSEMISAHALVYNNTKTLKMSLKNSNELPFALQIAGSQESILQKAVEHINMLDWVDIIDFNCGCPAPKVANHGNGSALLKDLPKFVSLLQSIQKYSQKHIHTVKVRLGFDKKIPVELAHAINESGVDYCVVHARTKVDSYKKERIDYESLARMKEILRIPLIANGEIDSLEAYEHVMRITNADGAMIGRAALKSPWIFWQIRSRTQQLPQILKRTLVLNHLDSMFEFYGEKGVIMFRKNLHTYAKGHKDSNKYKDFVNSEKDYYKIRESIEYFFA